MSFASLPWGAIAACTVVAFLSGGLWFGPRTFFPVWWKAMGRSADEKPGTGMNMGVVFGSTFAGQLVQAIAMALVVGAARQGHETFGAVDGALVGLVVGVGIAAAASLSHRLFGGFGFKVWLLEVSNDALNLTLMGAILGAWK